MGGQTGAVFYIYYEGMRHPHPILTRKKEFDLSKRKHGPTIVPALSAKVDNKENDSFRLETHCSSPSSSTHSAPAADFSISAWLWRAAEGRISFFRKRTQKSTGSRPLACGNTSTSWKLPVLSESIPESPHANQTDMSFVRAGSCRRHTFVRIPPWLYVVNLSRMETRAGRKKSHWLYLLE